jgi:hypothetical protein
MLFTRCKKTKNAYGRVKAAKERKCDLVLAALHGKE